MRRHNITLDDLHSEAVLKMIKEQGWNFSDFVRGALDNYFTQQNNVNIQAFINAGAAPLTDDTDADIQTALSYINAAATMSNIIDNQVMYAQQNALQNLQWLQVQKTQIANIIQTEFANLVALGLMKTTTQGDTIVNTENFEQIPQPKAEESELDALSPEQ